MILRSIFGKGIPKVLPPFFFVQLWLGLGVELMEIKSNLFSKLFHLFQGKVSMNSFLSET